MSRGLRRGLADLACRILQASLPPALRSWGLAIRRETARIPSDTEALLFALESLCGLAPRAITWRLLSLIASPAGDGPPVSGDPTTMTLHDAILGRPRVVGLACAVGAVSLGLVYMAVAGAPTRYLAVNAGALVIGLALLALLGRTGLKGPGWAPAAILALAGALLATALMGDSVEGAARWVRVGGLSIQPSLILLPAMLVAFARTRNAVSTAGVIAAAVAMAVQPDRAMAGMLAAGLAVLAMLRPDRLVVAALGAGIAGFAAALARSDRLPAVPYVDGILQSAFEVHPLAGAAVLSGSVLLLVPAVLGWRRDPTHRAAHAVFGTVWLAGILAAAVGNYPTPIVGYGASAIIGYALSLFALPEPVAEPVEAGHAPQAQAAATPHDPDCLVGAA